MKGRCIPTPPSLPAAAQPRHSSEAHRGVPRLRAMWVRGMTRRWRGPRLVFGGEQQQQQQQQQPEPQKLETSPPKLLVLLLVPQLVPPRRPRFLDS